MNKLQLLVKRIESLEYKLNWNFYGDYTYMYCEPVQFLGQAFVVTRVEYPFIGFTHISAHLPNFVVTDEPQMSEEFIEELDYKAIEFLLELFDEDVLREHGIDLADFPD